MENSTRFPPSVSDFNGLRFLNLPQDQTVRDASIDGFSDHSMYGNLTIGEPLASWRHH